MRWQQTYNAAGLLEIISPDEQLSDGVIFVETVCQVTQSLTRDLIACNTQPVSNTSTILLHISMLH